MTDADAKALSTVLDFLSKTIVAEAKKTRTEILAELRRRKPRALVPQSIKLVRARNQLAKARRENEELHLLLDKETRKVQSK